MAFGDFVSSGKVANASPGTGITTSSFSVTAGDLIVASYSVRQTGLTVTISSTLNNSWNALTGADGARWWWTVASSSGSMTVSFAHGTTTGDAFGLAVSYAGPYAASPLDKDIAAVSDITSPFTSGSTGTLTQADELVVGFYTCYNGITGFTATSPVSIADQGTTGASSGAANSISGVQFYKVVAATTSTTIAVSNSSNPTSAGGVSAATFKAASASNADLSAGTNTTTLTAAEESLTETITVSAGTNTSTVSAPAATVYAAPPNSNLSAGNNSITVTAPTFALVVSTRIAADISTVAVTAAEESLVTLLSIAGGSPSLAITAPTVQTTPSISISSGSATITMTSPAPSVNSSITISGGTPSTTITAPTATIQAHARLSAAAAGMSSVAPTATMGAPSLAAGTQATTISAPTATLTFGYTCDGQLAVAVSDIVVGGWTASSGSNLSAMIDETILDVDTYIRSPDYTSENAATFSLGTIITPQAGTVRLFVWSRKVS